MITNVWFKTQDNKLGILIFECSPMKSQNVGLPYEVLEEVEVITFDFAKQAKVDILAINQ